MGGVKEDGGGLIKNEPREASQIAESVGYSAPSTRTSECPPIDENLRQLTAQIADEVVERFWDRLRNGKLPLAPEYLSPRQVAQLTGIAIKTFEAMRGIRKGPPYFKVGGRVLYRVQDVRDYIESEGPVK